MKTLSPNTVEEIRQRVAMAWTIAVIERKGASINEQQDFAIEILKDTTAQIKERFDGHCKAAEKVS